MHTWDTSSTDPTSATSACAAALPLPHVATPAVIRKEASHSRLTFRSLSPLPKPTTTTRTMSTKTTRAFFDYQLWSFLPFFFCSFAQMLLASFFPCCSSATNRNSFQSFVDWSDWSTPGYLDPFETRLSKVKVKEKPLQQQQQYPPPSPPPAATAAEEVPHSTSSRTSLFSTSSWFSSKDDSFEYSSMASPPPPPPAAAAPTLDLNLNLAPTNPFLPYLLQSEAATLASVPEEEQEETSSSSPFAESLNAFHNPFFTWSKFPFFELHLPCVVLFSFVVASFVWVVIVQLLSCRVPLLCLRESLLESCVLIMNISLCRCRSTEQKPAQPVKSQRGGKGCSTQRGPLCSAEGPRRAAARTEGHWGGSHRGTHAHSGCL